MKSTWMTGRRARRALATAGLMTLATGLVPQIAKADSLTDLRAQAAQIANRINSLGVQEETLSEQYDAALIHQKAVATSVAQAKAAVAKANSQTSAAATALRKEAINAYVNNGESDNATVQSADNRLLQAEFEQSLASSQADAEDQYRLASETSATAEASLKQSEQAATTQLTAIKNDRADINTTITQLTSEESQAKGQIATLVTQDREAALKAAAAAYAKKLAAEREATTTTAAPTTAASTTTVARTSSGSQATTTTVASSTSSTTVASTTTTTVASSGGGTSGGETSVAAKAVAAALTRVGDPYVWGAAGPNSFDCSGLVMWSYDQAGVSLPHYSGAQYADTTHISMSDLEPGDLVFPSNPDVHVAMYIGNDEIVQAPYTGADVQVIPLSSYFVLASRVS